MAISHVSSSVTFSSMTDLIQIFLCNIFIVFKEYIFSFPLKIQIGFHGKISEIWSML